ncbi:type III restriction endonuclease subunit R [Morganella morganii]|uniref:type III restriction endonuclease subunit R n=1 Tax=Morganella morganii TaxID=582 RepID=UPI0020258AA6|nr:type III restriction endonuclease subunit R [Morganella morganii]
MDSKKFKYISWPCGAGKTTALCKLVNSSSEKYIIVQNTLELIKQTEKKINNCRRITTDTTLNNTSVIDEVIKFLTSDNRETLIITDKTFFKIPTNLLSNRIIYLDDITNFHSFKIINEDNKNVKSIIYNSLIKVIKEPDGEGKYIFAEKKKDIEGDLIKSIVNKEMSILSDNDYFIMNKEYFFSDKKQLNIMAYKDLNKYKGMSMTFMGANFEHSLIYKVNSELFERTDMEGLLTRKINLGDRLKVFYFSKKIKLSKTWKNNNSDKLQKIYNYIDQKLENQDFYWTRNKSDILRLKSGTEISPDARGFNQYNHLTECVWLACMRPSEIEAKQCELLFNLNGEMIHIAREYESLHQFVLRGISRDFESTETQIVYVFDEWQAKYLTDNIEYIDLGIDDNELKQRGRPQGSMNKEKRFTLDDKKAKRFRRWKASNPRLELDAFKAFLASSTNADLCTKEKEAMWEKYENEVRKQVSNGVQNTTIKVGKCPKNNTL